MDQPEEIVKAPKFEIVTIDEGAEDRIETIDCSKYGSDYEPRHEKY